MKAHAARRQRTVPADPAHPKVTDEQRSLQHRLDDLLFELDRLTREANTVAGETHSLALRMSDAYIDLNEALTEYEAEIYNVPVTP